MKSTSLGELEKQIMEVIWDCGECSVRDVLSKINRKRKRAYTTVATILQRLYLKGLLQRKETGKTYYYTPKISKKSYSKNFAKTFISKFIGSFGDLAIASFAESIETLPRKKRDYFLKLLENHDKIK